MQTLLESGEWPAPELLEQIASAGDAATAPLLAVLATNPHGWPEEAPLCNAMGLLSVLRPPAAIPALVAVAKRYDEGTAHDAAVAIARFGSPGFETLIGLFSDPAVTGYRRFIISDAALDAAGDDPIRRARLAELARTILEDQIAKAREELRLNGCVMKNPPDSELDDEDELLDDDDEFFDEHDELGDEDDELDDEDDELGDEDDELDDEDDELGDEDDELDDDGDDELDDVRRPKCDEFSHLKLHEADKRDPLELDRDATDEDEDEDVQENDHEIAPLISEEVAFFSGYLADLADPSALETIKTAFREGLVDESLVDENYVDEQYDAGGKPAQDDAGWLGDYREDYESHLDELRRRPAPLLPRIARPEYRYDDDYRENDLEPPPPLVEPIRNIEPRLGRNDPCWCGSGKKYKKCHLGKDALKSAVNFASVPKTPERPTRQAPRSFPWSTIAPIAREEHGFERRVACVSVRHSLGARWCGRKRRSLPGQPPAPERSPATTSSRPGTSC